MHLASLVEAERKGAKLVQRLLKLENASTTGMQELAAAEATNGRKKADGHRGEGTWSCSLPCCMCVSLAGLVSGLESQSRLLTDHWWTIEQGAGLET